MSQTQAEVLADSVANTLAGVRVLVIDDSATIRRSAEIALKQAGCHVLCAVDGFDALSKIIDSQPDVIFMDIMMPRLDGYATCTMLKRNPTFRDTPVIMLSSKDSVFDQARGRLAGADQYLIKPFTRQSLLQSLAEHLPSITKQS